MKVQSPWKQGAKTQGEPHSTSSRLALSSKDEKIAHLGILLLLADHEEILHKFSIGTGLLGACNNVRRPRAVPALQVAGNRIADSPRVQLGMAQLSPHARLIHLRDARSASSAQRPQMFTTACLGMFD
jgi:hypothetical protein